ncbi:hypothetical protein [Acuticoccus sp. I52.16.1]|uniref:hypothetical protein n=1 Tax=Acuticoccus sp. I52.16.1 TaxID=2928472 RepID=UPI001FD1EDA7|nr:hypothetical protein [Acuticoccus sp. I52.16.1]UOM33854.1 hypothetical protein MRB58_18755 [Acuticoccus sp. I52.16.1]
MKPALALLSVLALAACDAPKLTGLATGLDMNAYSPMPAPGRPEDASFAFEPFPGMPGNVGDELQRRLWRRMENEGLTVIKRPGGRAMFTIEGTLTAVSEDTNSLVFYVFEVKDVAGQRLHRISGTKRSNSTEGDPWASVDERDLDIIARRVAALVRAWLYSDA